MKPTHTVLQHSLEYPARVTSENDDGTLEMVAEAINNEQPFALSRVQRAPADRTEMDPTTPYWIVRVEPKADAPKANAPKA